MNLIFLKILTYFYIKIYNFNTTSSFVQVDTQLI
jgi:hypothetical protein